MNFSYVREDAPAQQSNDVSSPGPLAVKRPCCSTQEQGWGSLAGTAGLVNMQDNQDKHKEVTLQYIQPTAVSVHEYARNKWKTKTFFISFYLNN